MERSSPNETVEGFTLVELLVIIFTIVVLVALLLSGVPLTRKEVLRRECVNNLKQLGLAFRLSQGNRPDYRMRFSTNDWGTLEYIDTGETFRHFQVVSNELASPKPLTCPSDTRLAAINFSTGLSNTNISYFIGVDADETQPGMFLLGDRNITNGFSPINGMLILATNRTTEWTRAMHKFAGNVLLADGNVQHTNSLGLQKLVANTGFATNRVQLP